MRALGASPLLEIPSAHSHDMNTQATALFAQFDCDRSGGLDHAELMVALNALGLQTDPAQSAAILSRFDSDGNGRLDVGEVRLMLPRLSSRNYDASPRSDAP